ncbi:hypothetical protein AA957_05890 [Pseudomonas trivialis]|uniref:Uncharacterized protein n=1 Tax=Pseudomonas trivialis TaxID=200450 RepID=A0A0H5A7U6_9PSED|nr:hypothetical protein AA957_05890 [Pseudomonas trivialis]
MGSHVAIVIHASPGIDDGITSEGHIRLDNGARHYLYSLAQNSGLINKRRRVHKWRKLKSLAHCRFIKDLPKITPHYLTDAVYQTNARTIKLVQRLISTQHGDPSPFKDTQTMKFWITNAYYVQARSVGE